MAARWSFKRRNLQWRFNRRNPRRSFNQRNLHKKLKQPQLSHLVNLCLTNCPVARQTSCFVAFKLTAVILLFLLHNIPNLSQILTCYLFLIVLFLLGNLADLIHIDIGLKASFWSACIHGPIKFWEVLALNNQISDMFQNNSSKCMHGLDKILVL